MLKGLEYFCAERLRAGTAQLEMRRLKGIPSIPLNTRREEQRGWSQDLVRALCSGWGCLSRPFGRNGLQIRQRILSLYL